MELLIGLLKNTICFSSVSSVLLPDGSLQYNNLFPFLASQLSYSSFVCTLYKAKYSFD